MSSTTAAAAPGAWFGELASAVQGRWHEVVTSRGRGEQGPRQLPKLGAVASLALAERSKKAAAGQPTGGAVNRKTAPAAKEEDGDVGLCGATVSDATLYLLLDRFTPN